MIVQGEFNFKRRINWHILVVIVFAVAFFLGTSSYNFLTQDYSSDGTKDFVKWGSPDETANYIVSKLYAQTGDFQIFEKYNIIANDVMQPRSFRSDFGKIKPVSFLGLPLIYGKIANVTNYKVLPFLTPLFASLGILFFYLLIKELLGRDVALASSFLLASFPPFIYYSARSMFHNVLFVVLLIVSLYFMVLMAKRVVKFNYSDFWLKKIIFFFYPALAGIFLGASIATRTSELIWLGPSLFILWLININKVALSKILILISFMILAMLPVFYHNQILYSSPYLGGYAEMNKSIIALKDAGSDLVKNTINEPGNFANLKSIYETVKTNLFPFGILPKQSLRMFDIYFAKMFAPIFYLGILGFILFSARIKKWKIGHWAFLLSYFVGSLILIIYYGSWEFHDNPDPNSYTIGNSYTRYWLPVYLGFIPFASMAIIRITRILFSFRILQAKSDEAKFFSLKIGYKFLAVISQILIVSLVAINSVQYVLAGSEEGLIYNIARQEKSHQEWEKVINLTEGNSVIITRYHDKLFFPERKVIVGLFDDKNMLDEYAKLARLLPVYYYNFTLPEKDMEYLNSRRLYEFDLSIREVKKISDSFTLYKIGMQAD